MITGFNTDVKRGSRVFHVQTEDKGDTNPYVESLIYVGGEILAAKRTTYGEVLTAASRDGREIQEIMEQQHRTLIAAIQRGRFDGPNGSLQVPDDLVPRPRTAESDEPALPSLAPAAPRAPSGDRTLDQVVLEYLASEEQLEITMSPSPELVPGKPAEFKLKAETSPSRQPVPGATVHVRMLSTVSRPATVFQGKTGSDGACAVKFTVPAIKEGSAAAVVRVTSSSGSTEVRCNVKRRA